MPATANHNLRYPLQTDPANVPLDMQNLATDVDRELSTVGLTKIQAVTLGAAGVFDLNNIPQTFNHLRLLIAARSVAAAAIDGPIMRCNADPTPGGYYTMAMRFSDSGVFPAVSQVGGSDTFAFLGLVPAAQAVANLFGAMTIDFFNYRAGVNKSWNFVAYVMANTGTGNQYISMGGGIWVNGAALTRIQIWANASSGNFATGSHVTLYGAL